MRWEKPEFPPCRFYAATVTGATGLVGQCLVRKLLSRGVNVTALVRRRRRFEELFGPSPPENLRVVEGDLAEEGSVSEAVRGAEAVFHAAARVHSVPRTAAEAEDFFRVNVEGTRRLVAACRKHSVRAFVFFSTVAVYGEEVRGPLTETRPCSPRGPYAESKHAAEREVLQGFENSSTKAMLLRPSLMFGEGERGNFLRMLRAVHRGRFVFLGNGDVRKSMTYVENAVEAALLAAQAEDCAGEAFNVADPEPYPLRDVVSAIAGSLGVPPPRLSIPRSLVRLGGAGLGMCERLTGLRLPVSSRDVRRLTTDTVCDVSKLRARLKFEPLVSLQEGIARTVDWYLRKADQGG